MQIRVCWLKKLVENSKISLTILQSFHVRKTLKKNFNFSFWVLFFGLENSDFFVSVLFFSEKKIKISQFSSAFWPSQDGKLYFFPEKNKTLMWNVWVQKLSSGPLKVHYHPTSGHFLRFLIWPIFIWILNHGDPNWKIGQNFFLHFLHSTLHW